MLHDFQQRHIGPNADETQIMLQAIGVSSMDELINQTIPAAIRMKDELDLPEGISEMEFMQEMKKLAGMNKNFRSFIGLGYYETILPPVIQRNIFENPSWYTSYTPYQAEISQGRLQALLNFQTMVSDLTGLPIANASHLDEGTAAAEALLLASGSRSRAAAKAGHNRFFVDEKMFPQTLEVVKTRVRLLKVLSLLLVIPTPSSLKKTFFGALIQYADTFGEVHDYTSFIEKAHANGSTVAMAADILSLTLLKSPRRI